MGRLVFMKVDEVRTWGVIGMVITDQGAAPLRSPFEDIAAVYRKVEEQRWTWREFFQLVKAVDEISDAVDKHRHTQLRDTPAVRAVGRRTDQSSRCVGRLYYQGVSMIKLGGTTKSGRKFVLLGLRRDEHRAVAREETTRRARCRDWFCPSSRP